MGDEDGYVIRVRGLPWSATSSEVQNFFAGKFLGGIFISLLHCNNVS